MRVFMWLCFFLRIALSFLYDIKYVQVSRKKENYKTKKILSQLVVNYEKSILLKTSIYVYHKGTYASSACIYKIKKKPKIYHPTKHKMTR